MSIFYPENVKTFLEKDRIVLSLFILGSVFFEGSLEYRTVGVLMIFVFCSMFWGTDEHKKWKMSDHPKELIAFTLWILWAFVTMPLVSTHYRLIYLRVQTMTQVLVMSWIFYGMLRMKLTPRFVFFCVLCTAVVMGVMSLFGALNMVDDSIVGGPDLSEVRIVGFARTTNSNKLGMLMVRGVLCALFFWRTPENHTRFTRKILILSLVAVASYIVVISGSRKSSLYLIVALGGWFVWALPKSRGVLKLFSALFMLGIAGLVLSVFLPTVLEDTVLGKRWTSLIESGDGTITGTLENDARIHFFRMGVALWKENPIAGVGLGHFLLYNPTGQVSHSDYIESLTGTGIVGFVLYQSAKVFLLFRLLRLKSAVLHPYDQYVVKIMILMWLNVVLTGVGFHLYTDYQFIILLTTLSTYSWMWEKRLRSDVNSFRGVPFYPGSPPSMRVGNSI